MKFIIIKTKNIIITLFLFIIVFYIIFLLLNFKNISADKNSNIDNSNKSIQTSSNELENFYSKIQNLTNQKEKIAYLTFDDGPTLKSTSKILDILNEENVKASFFVIGKHVKEHPELIKRAYEEGHYIANHGYSHNNSKLYSSADAFINEITSTDIEIGKAIGVDDYCSHIFRFPNGYMSSVYKAKKEEYVTLLSNIDYTYIDWNCLNKDSEKKYSNQELLTNLKQSAKNKGTLVILMHDTSDVNQTDLVLKDSIDYLKKQGYTFKNFYE